MMHSDTVKGVIGGIITITAPYMQFLSQGMQMMAAGGGLILLAFSIMHKKVQYENEKRKANIPNKKIRNRKNGNFSKL